MTAPEKMATCGGCGAAREAVEIGCEWPDDLNSGWLCKSCLEGYRKEDQAEQAQSPRCRGLGKKTIALREAILDVLEAFGDVPMSSRQVAYQLVGDPWRAITNTEIEKKRVGRLIVNMRRDGSIPYARIVDRSRRKKFVSSWATATEYIDGANYRQNMWLEQPIIPMVACEKQALEGIFSEICDDYGVSLWTIKGFNSESFDYEWSEEIKELVEAGKQVTIAYFGDWDPSGLCIEETSRRKLEGFGASFQWVRQGLLEEDFEGFSLTPIPVKQTDSRAKSFLFKFGHDACAAELDALPPDELQDRIRRFIESYINQWAWQQSKAEEQAARDALRAVTDNFETAVRAARGAA